MARGHRGSHPEDQLLERPASERGRRDGLAGASRNVLSERLRELEEGGIMRRRKVGAASWELTESGRELHPILLQGISGRSVRSA